jgi:hypothetical protein
VERKTALQLARRLDWRFLLSDSTLTDVGFIGGGDETLLLALRQFSEAVTAIEPRSLSGRASRDQYGIVALVTPSLALLRRGALLVRPGGYLYAEIHRFVWKRRPSAVWGPVSYAAAMRQSGFVRVRVYWHWTNFDRCTRIIPLDDATPFCYVLTKGRSDASARAKAALGRRLMRSGLLGMCVPRFSVVAQKPMLE